MKVLILASAEDSHARRVAGLLTARGADPLLLDPGLFPARARLSAVLQPRGVRRGLVIGEQRVDLSTVASVWLRNRRPLPSCVMNVWDAVECRTVPGAPHLAERAERPLAQLLQARRVGFEVPPTLISADPQELLDFSAVHGLPERPWRHGDAGTARHWRLVTQAAPPRLMDLRVVVVGERVFAAEIVSHDDQRRVRPHELPAELAERCRRLIRALGLNYGTINLALTPDGRHVFLEADPGGGFLWLEEATRMPITDALCDLLLDPAAQPG